VTVSDKCGITKWCLEKQSAERDLTFIQLFSSEYNLYTSPAVRYISHPFSFILKFSRISAIARGGSCALLYIEYALAYSAITLLQPLAFLVLELSDRCPCR